MEPATFGSSSSALGTPYSAELSWKDIGCNVVDNKTMGPKRVLSGCTGTALPGQTIGLLGPSGAGTPFELTAVLLPNLLECNKNLDVAQS